MKLITMCTVFTVWALALCQSYAQEAPENETIIILKEQKEQVVEQEKEGLTREVKTINSRLENNEITLVEADRLKKEAAERRALNIENRLAIIENKIALIERNGASTEANFTLLGLGTDPDTGRSVLGISFKNTPDYERKYDRRTSSDLTFTFGLNNAIIDGTSLSDSPYKVAGSRYAELGITWSTRVFKESNWLRFRYGFSFQFNGLKPTDNRYFVDTGSETELQNFPLDLKKSKFRMDNLVVPIHFEFGPSKKIERENYFRYNTNNSFKVGIGGYAGINLGARQKLRFKENGEDVKQKLKANYNTNSFIYGLSGYIGFGDISLYAKYDLNTIFKNNPVEQRNASLGVRWDWD